MAEAETAEILSTDSPMFERVMTQGAYSLVVKRRGDAVFVEDLATHGRGNPSDLSRLCKRLLNWRRTTGLKLTIIVETKNRRMMRFMNRWRDSYESARVYTL